jgi:hypothetical protein
MFGPASTILNTTPADPAFRACSACDGDYEDPERTTWREDEASEDEINDDTLDCGGNEQNASE